MAPATPAKGPRMAAATPATVRTTRSKVVIPSTLAEGSQPSTPSAARGSRILNKAPMTTGKMGLLGKKPSRLFADKDGATETPVAKRIASFALPSLGPSKSTTKSRVPSASSSINSISSGKDTVQAFLRLRGSPSSAGSGANAGNAKPYIEIQGDKQVVMKCPIDPSRPHLLRPTSTYSFDRVFPPAASQNDVFEATTLPMVEQVLHGQGGLLFSYGVSNSGKTYTMQGDVDNNGKQDRLGMIPRAIQVVFDSIEGLACERQVKPVRQASVEFPEDDEAEQTLAADIPKHAAGDEGLARVVKVDRNYSYAIFVSHVEVYNDKIFDLLDSVPTTSSLPKASASASQIPRPIPCTGGFFSTSKNSFLGKSPFSASFGSRPSLAALSNTNGGPGVLTRQALALKSDVDGGRYISGMKEIRVRSKDEAMAVFMMGQEERQVFSTLANRQSSRSHGVFTIKVVRVHNGAPNDPNSASVSRLCMVDLAGSERNDKSQAEGERLREACNINKSLFALGTCLKTLRENQALMASRSTSTKRRPAVVSFKHVRLTEILESFFTGEGRVVMIVNVNPHDTGYQENSQVMEFSALATQVQTSALERFRQPFMKGFDAVKSKVQTGSVSKTQNKIRVLVPAPAAWQPEDGRLQQGETTQSSLKLIEEDLEVVEVDADDEDDNHSDALVDALMEELIRTRMKLMQAEMLNAMIEADVREEVVQEMHIRLAEVDRKWHKRLEEEMQAQEEKTDRKIDIMQRSLAAVQPYQYTEPVENEEVDEEAEDEFASAVDISVEASSPSLQNLELSPTPMNKPCRGLLSEEADEHSGSERFESELPSTAKGRVHVEIPVGSPIKDPDVVKSQEDFSSRVRSTPSPTRWSPDPRVVDEFLESSFESEDPLAEESDLSVASESRNLPDKEGPGEANQSGEDDDTGSEEESKDSSEEGGDEEDEEEEEDDEDVTVDNDSSFAISDDISTISSAPSTPPKRRTRRTTSAHGRKSITRQQSPSKNAPLAPNPVRGPKTGTSPGASSPVSESTKTPLRDILSQPIVVVDHSPDASGKTTKKNIDDKQDGTPDSEVKAGTIKRKRKLGKKAVLEDEVMKDESHFQVRRMLAGGRS